MRVEGVSKHDLFFVVVFNTVYTIKHLLFFSE